MCRCVGATKLCVDFVSRGKSRVKGYYNIMIHKNHSKDVYGLIDLRLGGQGLAPKLAT